MAERGIGEESRRERRIKDVMKNGQIHKQSGERGTEQFIQAFLRMAISPSEWAEKITSTRISFPAWTLFLLG